MWQEVETAEGLTYFYNSDTREVRWDPPDGAPAPAPVADESDEPRDDAAAMDALAPVLQGLSTKRARVAAFRDWALDHCGDRRGREAVGAGRSSRGPPSPTGEGLKGRPRARRRRRAHRGTGPEEAA